MSSTVPATEVTVSISALRCCPESSAFGRFVLVAKLIHLLGVTVGLRYAVRLFQNILLSPCLAGEMSSSPTIFFSHTTPALASSHQPDNSVFLSHHSNSSLPNTVYVYGSSAVLVLTQPCTCLFFNCFDIPQKQDQLYVPVLRSWLWLTSNKPLIASKPKFTAYQTLGKKADKKRYLFLQGQRENGLALMKICFILCIRWSVNPQGLRGSIKMPAKTSVVQPLSF